MSHLEGLFSVGLTSFLIAVALTPAVARLALAWGWLDEPDGRRKLHRAPVPAVGGVAVLTAFTLTSVVFELRHRFGDEGQPRMLAEWGPLALAALVVMAAGFVDDVRGVRPLTKLAVQALAAVYLFSAGFRIEAVSDLSGGKLELGLLALPVTVLWLVGMSNAFNLIDGMDGLAAGLALVSTVGLMLVAAVTGRWDTALVAGVLAGALVGFLPYNFHPARVFLGDCGALPVGMILAAIAVRGSMKSTAVVAVAVPLLALALPILDVALAIVRRLVRRKPVFQGDRDHIHHRLVEMGLTPRRAVVTLYGVAALFTGLALALAMGPGHVVWAAALVVVLVVWAGVRALGYWEVTEFQKSLASRLMAGRRASGNAALRALERELRGSGGFMDAWRRVCECAWRLGFVRLDLVPAAAYEALCPRLRAVAPAGVAAAEAVGASAGDVRLGLRPAAAADGAAVDAPAAWATWRIDVKAGKDVVAVVSASRPLQVVDFDPRWFVRIVRDLVTRKVVLPTVPLRRPELLGRRADPLGLQVEGAGSGVDFTAAAEAALPAEVEA